ncbi:hypothetical protein VPNG_02035 [Cytospora leucostoma]|uniref:Uncharacterized protein n=1 Tax=Cytospora leucostoma TaxID=1230097 RepID=A0A423XHU3_9PEZI|nr:hypothetical protein VPNG_02035 [Cytospora leucostoma]
MLTHLPSLGRGGGGGGVGGSNYGNTRTMSGIGHMSTSRSSSSAAALMSRGTRPVTLRDPAISAGGETAISLPSVSALTSASPRSAPSPVYCISPVPTADLDDRRPLSSISPRACREQLLVGEPAYLPGPTRHGYTGSGTQEPLVRLHSPSSGDAATRTTPSHGTSGATGSAHATIAAATSTSAVSAAAVLATAVMCTSGDGPPLPSASSVRMLLNTAAPHMVVGDGIRVVPVPITHHRLQRIYELRETTLRDHSYGTHDVLVLILAPPSMLRLLRSEQWIIKSEAVVVKWIRSVLLSGVQRRSRAEFEINRTAVCSSCGAHRQYCHATVQDELYLKDVDILRLLPSLIDHSQSSKELGSAYNILSHSSGLTLSSLPRGLTPSECQHIDFQAGRLIRRLSLLQSPSAKFGPAISVLCPAAVTQSRSGGGTEKPGGVDRWSLAFQGILEGILRDAEDMAVTIAYQTIRRQFRRLRFYLDAVTVPRLVILDAAHSSNIMAERKAAAHDGRSKPSIQAPCIALDLDDEESGASGDGGNPTGIRATGLRDWSNCTFGDPLMAMTFSGEPSMDFLRGFNGRSQRPRNGEHNDNTQDMLTMCGDIVEDPEGAHIRLLLYECYHATVAVVKEFYRPQSGSTERELAARKRLHAVLARLEDVETDPKRRYSRPPGGMSPAKKPRTDEEDGFNDEESPG